MKHFGSIEFYWADDLPKPTIPSGKFEFISYLLLTYRDPYYIRKLVFDNAIVLVLQGMKPVGCLQVDTVVTVEVHKEETVFKDWKTDEVVLTIPTADLKQVFEEWLEFISKGPSD